MNQQEQQVGLHSCPCLTRQWLASLHGPQAETSAQVKTVHLTVQAAGLLTSENTFLPQPADFTLACSPCLAPWSGPCSGHCPQR